MIYFNGDIKKIHYNGYDITSIYACGGNLVWSGETTPTPPIPPVGDKKVVGITTANTEWFGTDCSEGTSELLSHNIPVAASAISASEVGTCITIIGSGAFTNSVNMTTLVLPNTISYIRNVMLNGCSSMQSLTVYATTPPTFYATGGGSISNCGLFSAERQPSEPPEPIPTGFVIYVPCDSVNAYKTADVWSRYTDYIQEIPGTCSSTTKFSAVYSDSSTYSINCDGNTTLTSGETRPSGYISSLMTSAVIGDCVTTIGNRILYYCNNLTSLTISDSVTSIGEYAFYYCSGLTSVIIPSGVTSIGGETFEGCYSLTSIDIPNSVTSIGSSAFESCSSLSSVTISNSITMIESYVFNNCTSLTSVIIPSGVTSIGQSAFRNCWSLTSIDIPDSVTSIGTYAFRDCSGLTSCTIGSGVTLINSNAFYNATSLTSVIVNAVTPPKIFNPFNTDKTYPIYVPAESVELYKAANDWYVYASRIQPIP